MRTITFKRVILTLAIATAMINTKTTSVGAEPPGRKQFVAVASVPSSGSEQPDPTRVEFLGITSFSGNAIDGSGLTSKLEDQSPANRLGGFSAIEYTGQGDRFILMADRGAGDGAVSFPCRMHQIDLRLNSDSKRIEAEFAKTVMLTAMDSSALDGSCVTAGIDRTQRPDQLWHAMDPEGIRRWKDGFLISDEYGPHLGVFDRSGRMTKEWKLPQGRCYGIVPENHPAGTRLAGCFNNRGLEGLAVVPSSQTVWATFQSSLLQDGELVNGRCQGDLVRWIAFDAAGNRTREVAYPLDIGASGISEILAVDEHRMLVLERDSNDGDEAKFKRIFLADHHAANDVKSVETLPADQARLSKSDSHIQVVEKRLLIDLLNWKDELGEAATAEKPEGLAWGRTLKDGRRTLWVCWDNDFETHRDSYVACFAVDLH